MTDHKAEAERLLDEAVNSRTNSMVESSRQMQALVHATLAVAEQQRITNLIALATHREQVGRLISDAAAWELTQVRPGEGPPEDDGSVTFIPDAIKDGLGLS